MSRRYRSGGCPPGRYSFKQSSDTKKSASDQGEFYRNTELRIVVVERQAGAVESRDGDETAADVDLEVEEGNASDLAIDVKKA